MPVHSYPAFLYLGLVVGTIAGNRAANHAGLDSARVFVATILLLVPALMGARLLFVAAHWDLYRPDLRRVWRRSEGGFAMYGGLPAALCASVPLLIALDLPFGAFWDVATFTILSGMFFTRFGCLLNGCCAGRPTSGRLSLYLPNAHGVWRRRVPSQLLEAGWSLCLLTGAVFLWKRLAFPGALFLYLLAGYGTGRFFMEPAREGPERVGRVVLYRAFSGLLLLLAATLFLVLGPA
jgi:prolipoprotein diacylglyceryltransferase